MEDPFLFRHTNAAELFLVRHGDAIPDEDEIIPSGLYDNLPLSRVGREQAQALAQHHPQDGALLCAECHANSDLTCLQRHRVGHHAEYPNDD